MSMQRLGAAHPQVDSLQPGLGGPHQGCRHQLPLGLQAWVGWLEPGGWAGAGCHGGALEECVAMSLQHTSVISLARNICIAGVAVIDMAYSSSYQQRRSEDVWSVLGASDPRSSSRLFISGTVPDGTELQAQDTLL